MMITSIFAGIFTVSRAFSTFLVCILSLATLKTKNHTKKVLNALEKVKIPAKMLVIPPIHIYRYINRYSILCIRVNKSLIYVFSDCDVLS